MLYGDDVRRNLAYKMVSSYSVALLLSEFFLVLKLSLQCEHCFANDLVLMKIRIYSR